jgi:hypothetical protein
VADWTSEALIKEQTALQNMNFLNFFLFLWSLLPSWSEFRSGSEKLITIKYRVRCILISPIGPPGVGAVVLWPARHSYFFLFL